MTKQQLFESALVKSGCLDLEELRAVSKIHELLYESADSTDGESNDDENSDYDDSKESDENDGNVSEDSASDLYSILGILTTNSNAYQNYHWNAESASLHELSQAVYELYRETYDKLAESIMAITDKPISSTIWGKVPSIGKRDEFYGLIEDDIDEITKYRDKIEKYKMFGINSVLDSFLDELTTIKYKLIRFFENGEGVK